MTLPSSLPSSLINSFFSVWWWPSDLLRCFISPWTLDPLLPFHDNLVCRLATVSKKRHQQNLWMMGGTDLWSGEKSLCEGKRLPSRVSILLTISVTGLCGDSICILWTNTESEFSKQSWSNTKCFLWPTQPTLGPLIRWLSRTRVSLPLQVRSWLETSDDFFMKRGKNHK